MDLLIVIGAVVSVLGLAGLIGSGILVFRAKKQGLEDEALRAKIQMAIPLNIGALLLSMMGLAMVVIGIQLG